MSDFSPECASTRTSVDHSEFMGSRLSGQDPASIPGTSGLAPRHSHLPPVQAASARAPSCTRHIAACRAGAAHPRASHRPIADVVADSVTDLLVDRSTAAQPAREECESQKNNELAKRHGHRRSAAVLGR